MAKTIKIWMLSLSLLALGIGSANANLLTNPGFEDGLVNGSLSNVVGWTSGLNYLTAGEIVDNATEAHSGSRFLKLSACGNTNRFLTQQVAISEPGSIYQARGWIKTPTGADQFLSTNAWVQFTFYCYTASSSYLASVSSPRMNIVKGDMTTWTEYVCQPIITPSNTAFVRVNCAYNRGSPQDTRTSGVVYFDDVVVEKIDTPAAGAILNPSFEVMPNKTIPTGNVPQYWDAYGNAFAVTTGFVRSGQTALQIWWKENLVGQDFPAVPGTRYEASGYVASPTIGTWAFTSEYAFGALVLNYLDENDNILGNALSEMFTGSSPKNEWMPLSVSGVAPVGTVKARVFCAVLKGEGPDDGDFSGCLFFDDITQRVVSAGGTVSGLVHNPGFEDGPTGNAYNLAENEELYNWAWLGGTNAGFVVTNQAQSGAQALDIVWPNNLAGQEFVAEAGMSYIVDGYIYTPTVGGLSDTTAFASIILEFYNPAGAAATTSVSVLSSEQITYSSAKDVWHHVCFTNRAPWNGPVTGKVLCAYLDLDAEQMVGEIFFDSLTITATNITEAANVQSGALWNPGFEYSANGTKLPYIDSWYNMGFDGSVDSSFARTGSKALKITYTETLLGQNWTAVPGYKYATEGYVSSSPTAPFTGSTNAMAIVLLQYLDASGTNVLATYPSALYQPTNGAAPYTPGVWTKLSSRGVAPQGTVFGRTVCAVVGNDDAFSGAVYFDDLTQSLVSTGNTVSGLAHNPGFEDGIGGNAYNLYVGGDFNPWVWLGGTNAGFVVNTRAQSGDQSLDIVWPNNLAGQEFVAEAGMSYIVDGYIYTPTVGGLSDTTAFASIILEFYNPAGAAATTSVSVLSSEQITYSSAKDVWHHVCFTNRAPWNGPVTGKVLCAYLDLDAEQMVGEIFFDSLTITATNITEAANVQSGALWNPGFEYTANGTKLPYIDSWYNMGFDGAVDSSFVRSGSKALKITYPETLLGQNWSAVPGYKYSVEGYVSSSPTAPFTGSTNAMAIVLLQYLDASGTNVLATYPSALYQPTDGAAPYTPGVWTKLSSSGVAPLGTVSGRTVCAVVGIDDAFSGAVYFDDLSQSLVSTGGSVSGLLLNPGFEDTITGNAYTLDNSGELPYWTWGGGDNAGFIVNTYAQAGDQCLALSWPGNYMLQDFEAEAAEQYVISGYMFTPSGADQFTSDGTSYGYIMVAFYIDGSTDPVIENIYMTEHFTAESTPNQWTYFCVTSTVPMPADPFSTVVGRVACTIYSADVTLDSELGGIICFDSLSVVKVGSEPQSPYANWQVDTFGSTNAANSGMQEDYDNDGFDNWSEFIAGTDAKSSAAFLNMTSATAANNQQLVLRWSSVAGRYYRVLSTTNKQMTGFTVVQANIPATPPMNGYTSSVPAGVSTYYYRLEVSTNSF